MNLSLFIANRMGGDHKSIMVRVATCAVAIGITVMIISIAVIAGFKSQIEHKLSSLSGHIVVTDVVGVNPSSHIPIEQNSEIESLIDDSGAPRRSAYILRGAIARSSQGIEGVIVKGVEAPQREGLSRREVLVSSELATSMEIESGSRLELLFSDDEGEISRLTFRVAGLLADGLGSVDNNLIITDIDILRKVNGWAENQISGYEVWLKNMADSQRVVEELNESILYTSSQERTIALSLEDIHPTLFDWLRTHDLNGVVVGIIMVIVAIFNMATALLILVLERARMVGILKSLGMNNGSLASIFLYRAGWIILRGVAWGNAIAMLLCFVQHRWGVLKLEASGYILSVVPIDISAWWVVMLNVAFAGVVLLVMTLPVRIVASISPDEIVKYR